MHCTILLALAVGPDIHIHFVSCEEIRQETAQWRKAISWKYTLDAKITHNRRSQFDEYSENIVEKQSYRWIWKKKRNPMWSNKRAPRDRRALHRHLTIIYLLTPKTGTSVCYNDNNKGQHHICTDDACYCSWLNPVARHCAVW